MSKTGTFGRFLGLRRGVGCEGINLKEQDAAEQLLRAVGGVRQALFPSVEAVSADVHRLAEQHHGELAGELQNYFVFPFPYRITVPSHFTSYPFFRRASLMRAIRSSWMSSSRVIDLKSASPAGAAAGLAAA